MIVVGPPGSGWRAIGAASFKVVVCLAVTIGAAPAQATERIPVRLSFVGSPGCNDQRALEREVERRAEVVSWATSEGASITIAVRLVDGVGRLHSVLFVEGAGRPGTTRAITGGNCAEVIEGTALIIAVLLSQRATAYTAASVPPAAVEPAAARPTTERSERRRVPEQRAQPLRWRLGGGASGVLVHGIAPGVLPGVGAFVDLSTEREGWAPTFQLSFRHLWRSGFVADDARAAFRLTSGVAVACPAAWLLDRIWTLRPCAAMSYGSLEASGSNAEVQRTVRHPWAGFGGGLLLEAQLDRSVSLQLEAASEVALVKSRFRFGDVAFHETSPVTTRGGLSLSLRVPSGPSSD